jgi:hypothetical protein
LIISIQSYTPSSKYLFTEEGKKVSVVLLLLGLDRHLSPHIQNRQWALDAIFLHFHPRVRRLGATTGRPNHSVHFHHALIHLYALLLHCSALLLLTLNFKHYRPFCLLIRYFFIQLTSAFCIFWHFFICEPGLIRGRSKVFS